MCIAPVFAGLLFGHGLEHALFMELTINEGSDYKNYLNHETGQMPLVYGCVFMGISLVILGIAAYRWKAGWDDTMFESTTETPYF